MKISCIEEIAYRMGYINSEQLRLLGKEFGNSSYGRYLLRLTDQNKGSLKLNKKICVIGAGYWGKNHITTLERLNALNGIVEIDKPF